MSKVYTKVSKKDGSVISYYLVAYIGTRDDGTFFQKKITLNVSDLPPGTPTTPKKQQAAAEKELDRIVQELREEFQHKHGTEDRNHITLADFIENHWWPDKVMNGTKSPNTVQFYKDQKSIILDYFSAKTKLVNIDTEAIIRFNNYQRTVAKKANGESISQSTAAHRYSALRAIINYAYRLHYIKKNPVEYLEDDDKIVQEKHEVFYLKEDEIRDFLDMLEAYSEQSDSKYWQVYFSIALFCGLRRAEVIPLFWGDILVNSEGKASIIVSKSIVRDPTSPDKYAIREPKNHKTRIVPIPDALYAQLAAYKEELIKCGVPTLPESFIFPRKSDPSRPMYVTTPTKKLHDLETRYNLAMASVHDLRHTTGSTLSAKGTPLKVIQALLGHSSIAVTTGYYVGTDDTQLREAVNKMQPK